MPRTRQGSSGIECSDVASRASSRDERPVGTGTPLMAETFKQTVLQQHLILQQQPFLRELIDRINPAGGGTSQIEQDEPQRAAQADKLQIDPPIRARRSQSNSQRFSDSFANANATKWLATRIPEFGGTESDNINVWIKRVDKVVLIHGASDSVTLLAASSKLTKNAKQWYDLQDGPSNESWMNLKHELTKMFDKKVHSSNRCNGLKPESGMLARKPLTNTYWPSWS